MRRLLFIRCGAALLMLSTALFTAACGGDVLLCGEGAVARDGECVATSEPITCGDGARLDEATNECVSAAACGPGTTYDAVSAACITAEPCGAGTHLDEDSRRCLPDATCGEGTVWVAGVRECVPAVSCGLGTELDVDLGVCVAVDQCGAGTEQHPVRRVCIPSVRCGPGLVAHETVCLSPADIVALGTDLAESLPDNDDVAFGGTPTLVTLEGIGDSLVVTGTIQRPIDQDGDDELDADLDHFRFEGLAGARLRIRVLNDGIGQPAFRLTGPEGYERSSRVGVVREPNREVVLPRDGVYDLTVGPASVFVGGPPVGGPERAYVLVIEELPWPAGTIVVPPAVPDLARLTLNALEVRNNFMIIETGAPGPLLLDAAAADVGTHPVALLFSEEDGEFLGEVTFEEDDGRFYALDSLYVTGERAWLILEWTESAGVDTGVEFAVSTLASEDLGVAAPDTTLDSGVLTVAGRRAGAVSFDATAGQVVTLHLPGITRPRIVVVGPDGFITRTDALLRSTLTFVPPTSGRHHVVVLNRSVSDVRIPAGVISQSAGFDGPLVTGGAPAVQAGAELGFGRRLPARAGALVSVAADTVVHAVADFAVGMPDLEIHRVSATGALVDTRRLGEDDPASLRLAFAAAGRALVLLDPGASFPRNPVVRDWRLDVSAVAVPVLGDSEGDEIIAGANELAGVPAWVAGETDVDDVDVWQLDVPADLGADERLAIEVVNLDGSGNNDLRVLDAAGEEIGEGRPALTTAWRVFPGDGPGPFFLEVSGRSTTHRYALAVERRGAGPNQRNEIEPNDTDLLAMTLDAAAGLPLEVHGATTKDAPDVFELLPTSGGDDVWLRVENIFRSSDFDVTVTTAAGSEFITMDHEDASIIIPAAALPASVEVVGELSTRIDHYRLQVRAAPGALELEPNDTPAAATDLVLDGEGRGTIFGQEARSGNDLYRVTLPAPLTAGSAIEVRWQNLLERGDILVRILDDTGTDVIMHEEYEGAVHVLPTGTTFFVAVSPQGFGSNVRPELYELNVAIVAGSAEVEPNDTAATAQLLAAGEVMRGLGRADDPDVYLIGAAALSGATTLTVRAERRLFELEVVLKDNAGVALFTGRADTVGVDLSALPADVMPVTVEITAQLTGFDERGNYTVSLQP